MASEAIGLGYMASDIVLQPSVENHKSQVLNSQIGAQAVPMVLEVNAQPGLKIQIANRAGLRERLNRVKGLKIVSAKHGIRVAQALFVDPMLAEKGLGRKTINVFEKVMIMGLNGEKLEVDAKIDTGADFSSLDVVIAEKLGLLDQENVIGIQTIRNSVGSRKRQTVGISFIVGGKKMKTQVTIADRSKLKYKMLIGKHDLVGFAVVINQHVI
jgi:hypothetical protein